MGVLGESRQSSAVQSFSLEDGWGKVGMAWGLVAVFHRFQAMGKSDGVWARGWAARIPLCQLAFPQLCGRRFWDWLGALEAHHAGHRRGVGIQAGVEFGVVVLDGCGGIFQAVAGEHTHHGGAIGYLAFALE